MSRTEIKEYILENRKKLVKKIMEEQMRLLPELKEKYNSVQLDKSKSDISYTLNYLAQAISVDEKIIFSNYYNWLYSILKQKGMDKEFLKKHLLVIKNVLKTEVDKKDFELISDFLTAAGEKLESPENHYQSFIREDNPLKDEAEKYLSFLIDLDRSKAVDYILNLADHKNTVEEIYLKIFQPVQYEIGRLWQLGEFSVAQEHYATSVTQLAMSQLYPKIFSSFSKGKKSLTTCIGDELHELGIRMVADLLELNGWDTIHLGSNTPVSEIINIVEEKGIDLLALSATLPNQLDQSRNLIKALRKNDKLSDLKIMVGGRVFMQSDELWRKVGADGFASNAKEAVKVADSLL